ncbi:protein of unknown function DUF505 [Thermodesulfatator indicus DSM 15286]|uniref:DUF505 domain-containing protein n=1 Tax=Thermodesulfatator indicus (strain DSM 15286 / JCM 11887 / CIR29812) TaxID=667014 RepID=F8ACH7_THEID|nr:DUF505 domain-containing protein [Thermodesulfatator indicus]AEH44678.1 protein of unknown function DUF505 [Thermodesulfatator indicus DSM 15286]
MLIKKEHAEALLKLLSFEEETQTKGMEILEADEDLYLELEMQALVRQSAPLKRELTYLGKELALVLRDLIDREKLPSPEKWPEGFRWLGTEIVAMLEAAGLAGQVGPLAVEPLQQRGLAAQIKDKETGKEYIGLTEAGKRIFEIYQALEPELEISAELAQEIRKLPAGPARASLLTIDTHTKHLLEAMRLIAYSVPTSDIYAFTALGQAVKKALTYGGFGEGDVLTSDILWALADVADEKEVPEATIAILQSLGYIDQNKELLPAGYWALEVLRLWKREVTPDAWTVAIEEEEVEILQAIEHLWQKAENNPEETPTFKNLRAEMIDRKIKQYKEILARYGRKIEEMPEKYQQIASQFMEAKDLARWYDDNFSLRLSLYSLESFNLIHTTEDQKGREVFELTDFGRKVIKDQEVKVREISSTAVKAITITHRSFSAPNVEWVDEALEEGLLGTGEPTRSGYFYAELAETISRMPHLTRYEAEILASIPSRGISVEDLFDMVGEGKRRRFKWALEKLEARHLINVMPDGNIIETEAGEMIDRAVSGVPKNFGHPINPLIYRVLKALAEVGTLFVKEKRIRILPKNIKEAIKRSGLPAIVFDEALKAARHAGYVGKNTITEAGYLILQAVDKMNPHEEVRVFYAGEEA